MNTESLDYEVHLDTGHNLPANSVKIYCKIGINPIRFKCVARSIKYLTPDLSILSHNCVDYMTTYVHFFDIWGDEMISGLLLLYH